MEKTFNLDLQIPLENQSSIMSWKELFEKVIDFTIDAAILFSILAIIFIGFQFISSKGKPEEISKTKNKFILLLIGLMLLFSAKALGGLVGDIIDPPKGGDASVYKEESTGLKLKNVFIVSAQSTKGELKNPLDKSLGEGSTIFGLLQKIIDAVVTVAIPILFLIYLYVGFLFIKATGNKDRLTEAKNYFVSLIIGTVLILSASSFIKIIEETYKAFK